MFMFVPIYLVFGVSLNILKVDKKQVWNILCINESSMLSDRISVINSGACLNCLASSCVKDTLGHTLTPIFFVKGSLPCFLPKTGRYFLQVSLYYVKPILSVSTIC